MTLTPIAATVLALCLLRWWPYLLAVGGLLCVPVAWPGLVPESSAMTFYQAFGAAVRAVCGIAAPEDLRGGRQFVWHGKIQHLRLEPNAPYRLWRVCPAEDQR